MYAQTGTSPIAILEGFRNQDINLLEYIDQLEEHFNAIEDKVMAFVSEEGRFDRLREDARALLKKYPKTKNYPPLFGMIIGVKDIFNVDGFPTHAGSKLPIEALQGEEAAVVTQIKALGALVLGKTITTEFAYFAPGPTRNPHDLKHTPGGSSSGSAAAVAAGMVMLAFGTQTIGSISRPASFCGVVGFKPSYNRLSTAGVIPLSHSLDHIGVLTPDLATTALYARHLLPGYSKVDLGSEPPVVAVPTGPYLSHASKEMRTFFDSLVERIASRGIEVQFVDVMPDFEEIVAQHNLITAAEAAVNHAFWYPEYAKLYHPKTLELIERGRKIEPGKLRAAKNGRLKLRDQLMATMLADGIDLWISPSATGPAPKGLESTGDPVMNLPWTNAGLPTLSIPAGINSKGLPLGLQLTGGWYNDERLLEFAPVIQEAIR